MPDELVRIEGDRFHVSNLISNLVDNAIKYSKNSVYVSITLSKQGDAYILEVSDKGIGIKKEHLNKIFDKLYRIPTGNVHDVKGFGLGLSYVRAVAELHGWSVEVKSKFGEGSTFTVTIS
jgi:two-component system phosphate regulon sensor histidine kinase PhoR